MNNKNRDDDEEELKECRLRPTYDSLMAIPDQLSDILEYNLGLHSKRGYIPGSKQFYTPQQKIYSIISVQNHPTSKTIQKIENYPHNQQIDILWLFDIFFDDENMDEEWKIVCVCNTAILSKIVVIGKNKYFVHNGCIESPVPKHNNNRKRVQIKNHLPIYDTSQVAIMAQNLFTKCGAKLDMDMVIEYNKRNNKLNGNGKYVGINDAENVKQKKKASKPTPNKKRMRGRKRQRSISDPDDYKQDINNKNEPKAKKRKTSIGYIASMVKWYATLGTGGYGAVSLVLVKGETLCAFKASRSPAKMRNEAKWLKTFCSKYVVKLVAMDWNGTDDASYIAETWGGIFMEHGDPDIPQFRLSIAGKRNSICRVTEQVLHNATKAVMVVHAAGYVVVDLKLRNLIIKDGLVKLIDFGGIALIGGPIGEHTTTNSPPEYISDKVHESRSKITAQISWDMWCLGLIAYEFANGSSLFRETDYVPLLSDHMNKLSDDNLFNNVPMDKEMIAIVKKLLSYYPQCRYNSCAKILDEPVFLSYFLTGSIDEQLAMAGYSYTHPDHTSMSPQVLSEHYNPFLPKQKSKPN